MSAAPLFFGKSRSSASARIAGIISLALVTTGLVALPQANATVTTVPGISATIIPATCKSILDFHLTNNTTASQQFWLRQPITAPSIGWVVLPAHTTTEVEMSNPQGSGSLNWGVILNGKQRVANQNIARYSGACYSGAFMPSLNDTAPLVAQLYPRCGAREFITVRNQLSAERTITTFRNGSAAGMPTIYLGSGHQLSYLIPIATDAASTVTVKNGTTVLTQGLASRLGLCTTATRVDWGNSLSAQDQFNGTNVDESNWWVYNSPTSYPQRLPSQVSESDGELKLTGHVDPTYGTEESGGIGYKTGQTYGHWEVRFKYDAGGGYRSAILLWPDDENWPTEGEIDMSEIFNAGRTVQTEFQHNGPQNKVVGQSIYDDMTQWHTIGIDWLPNRVVYFLDGQEIWSVVKPTNGSFDYVPHVGPMHLTLQNDTLCTTVCTSASTPANVTLHVDWMKQWALPSAAK